MKTSAVASAGMLLSGLWNKTEASPRVKKQRAAAATIQLRFKAHDLLLRYPFTVATFSRTMTPSVMVELEYEGVTGYGEAAMPQYLGESQASVLSFLQRVDLAAFRSPFEMDDILTYVDGLAENNTAAKASIDIALHDLVGKLVGQPWYKLWGLNIDKIPPTTYTIGMDTEEVVRKKTREYVNDFKILKVKLGKESDKMMINTIRQVTDLPLAVDANQGWQEKHEALEMIHWLKEQGVVMVEQPMSKHRLDDNAWITERSPIPIYADESVQRLSDIDRVRGAFNGINIKLMKCTGMREAWKMVNYARALHMDVMIGCMTETSCAISAAAQLSPMMDFCDLDGNLLIQPDSDPFVGASLHNGVMRPNERPGLGLIKKG